MTEAWVWILIAVILPPQFLQIGLMFAPRSFWRNLAAKHRGLAHYLWGFSHLFGPLSRPGEPPAWERSRANEP